MMSEKVRRHGSGATIATAPFVHPTSTSPPGPGSKVVTWEVQPMSTLVDVHEVVFHTRT